MRHYSRGQQSGRRVRVAAFAALKKASKTLDRLLAAQGVDVEEVIAEFKAVRKQASPRKKPKTIAACSATSSRNTSTRSRWGRTTPKITEYISKNTVIPHLLEQARERCKVAFLRIPVNVTDGWCCAL
ncbi:MAG: hypothetical protein Q7S97_11575 [Polaromonas sp.]|nr:hypothetical protein [Polaromonas sp.]